MWLINFLSVEETHEPREIQDVKIETEIEVLDQSETQESPTETNIEAGNELKGTPDLLEQAVSQIKIHPVEIKSTTEETEMLEPGPDLELKNILPVGLQCKLCQAKFMSNKGNLKNYVDKFWHIFTPYKINFLGYALYRKHFFYINKRPRYNFESRGANSKRFSIFLSVLFSEPPNFGGAKASSAYPGRG